jgi:hypothetical protein
MTTRRRLPDRRPSAIFSFEVGGHRYIASFSRFPGTARLAEVFLDSGKPNSLLQTRASDSAVLVSLLLQYGVDLEVIRYSISGPIRAALDMIDSIGDVS